MDRYSHWYLSVMAWYNLKEKNITAGHADGIKTRSSLWFMNSSSCNNIVHELPWFLWWFVQFVEMVHGPDMLAHKAVVRLMIPLKLHRCELQLTSELRQHLNAI